MVKQLLRVRFGNSISMQRAITTDKLHRPSTGLAFSLFAL